VSRSEAPLDFFMLGLGEGVGLRVEGSGCKCIGIILKG
jgi:hypothetical protein